MTSGALWDRLRTIVEASGYPTPASQPFNFELQPAQQVEACYCMTMERGPSEGWIGGAQEVAYLVTIFVAKRTGDHWGSYRQLLADLPIIEASITADEEAGQDYHVSDDPGPNFEIPQPTGQAYQVGRLQLTILTTD